MKYFDIFILSTFFGSALFVWIGLAFLVYRFCAAVLRLCKGNNVATPDKGEAVPEILSPTKPRN
jgi:hypothetical protein